MRAREDRRAWRLAGGPLAVAVLALAASAAAETTAASETSDTGWEIRFYAAAIDMDHSSAGLTRPAGTTRGYDTSVGGGVGFNAEYHFSKRLGIDLGLLTGGNVEIEAHTYRAGGTSWTTYDTLTFTPLTVGLDIHLTPDSPVDFYACPMVALIQYSSVTWYDEPSGTAWDVDFDEDFGLGARLGIGVPFGQNRWSFQANLTYLDSSLEGRGANGVRIDSGYDSTILGLGVGYRFRGRGG